MAIPAIAPGNTKLGWIGTGVMGRSMCGHLIKAGYEMTVSTRTKEKAADLIAAGAQWAESPKAVAQQSDVVFAIVGYPRDVREVMLGDDGALAGSKEGNLLVDMTTSEPSLAEEIAREAKNKGVYSVDAPVSGGDVGAIVTLAGSHVVPVPGLFHDGGDVGEENPPTDGLAFHLETQATAGDLPFYALPTLGGTLGRGFIAGRFRDQHLWLGSAEYRVWVIPRGFALSPWTPEVRVERLGLAFFYDVGSVDDEWPHVFGATPKHSGGVGLRITLERHAPFRVDVGFSGEDVQVSAGFGLPF